MPVYYISIIFYLQFKEDFVVFLTHEKVVMLHDEGLLCLKLLTMNLHFCHSVQMRLSEVPNHSFLYENTYGQTIKKTLCGRGAFKITCTNTRFESELLCDDE